MQETTSEMEHKYIFENWGYQGDYHPKVITKVEGCYLYDDKGKKYLDFTSQSICSNLGLRNETVIQAIRDQASKIPYVSGDGDFTVEARIELGRLLAELAPKGLTKTFLTPSGADAVEDAIKIARQYTRKSKIVSRYRSYHGGTTGAMSVMGDPRRHCIEPEGLMPGVVRAPDAYCYRCPFGLNYPDCGITCAEYINYIIEMELKDKIAAVLVEPIVGSNGVIVPPDEYLPRLREITREAGILLICDEVMTGFGRTGEWFGVDHYKVSPDIMTLAKGLAASYVPAGATMTTSKIADYFEDNYFGVGHTYSGHPLAAAAAVAAIKEYRGKKLIENARKMGGILGKRLNELKDKHRSIGDVRGKGLFWGVELVKNRSTKEPFVKRHEIFTRGKKMTKTIVSEAMRGGVLVASRHYTSTISLAPPLIVTEKEISEAIDVFDKVLKVADNEAK